MNFNKNYNTIVSENGCTYCLPDLVVGAGGDGCMPNKEDRKDPSPKGKTRNPRGAKKKQKVLPGFEPRLLDSKSSVITTTL